MKHKVAHHLCRKWRNRQTCNYDAASATLIIDIIESQGWTISHFRLATLSCQLQCTRRIESHSCLALTNRMALHQCKVLHTWAVSRAVSLLFCASQTCRLASGCKPAHASTLPFFKSPSSFYLFGHLFKKLFLSPVSETLWIRVRIWVFWPCIGHGEDAGTSVLVLEVLITSRDTKRMIQKEVANPSYPSCKPLELQLGPRRTLEETNSVLGNSPFVDGSWNSSILSEPKPGSPDLAVESTKLSRLQVPGRNFSP